MKPERNILVIGYFHQCWNDETYKNHIDDFRRMHSGHIVWKTQETEVWVFSGEKNDDELTDEWTNFLGNGCRETYFETIDNHHEWIKTWAKRIPTTLIESINL